MLNYNIRNEIVNKIYKLNYQDCIEELKEIEHTFGDRENGYWDDGAFYQEHTIKIIRNIMVNKHNRGKDIYETKKFIIKYKYMFVEEHMNDENIPYIYQNDDKIYRFKLDTCVYVEKNEKTLVFNNFNEI